MNMLNRISADSTTSGTEKLIELLKNPVLWGVVGGIILLLIIWYLVRRNIKAKEGTKIVVLHKGQIKKVLDGNDINNNKYYLIPFTEKVGARLTMLNNEFSSDNLQVNDGPDKLYKINFTMKYDIKDVKSYYEFYKNDINNYFVNKINETLRKYVYEGNGDVLLKNYMKESYKIVEVLNEATKEVGIDIKDFKINTILLVK